MKNYKEIFSNLLKYYKEQFAELEKEIAEAIAKIEVFLYVLEEIDYKEWSYVNILDTKSQTFLCCTSS